MMTNIFSIFDPSLFYFNMTWWLIFFVFLFLPMFYWLSGTINFFFYNYVKFFSHEVDCNLNRVVKGLYNFVGAMFILVGCFNFLALFPYIFSFTSHLSVTFPLSFVFWFMIIFFCFFNFFSSFLSHLIPTGTPMWLMSFMVLVEFMSNIIRPIALTFRLTANMMVGHLLMSLLGGFLFSLHFSIFTLGSLIQFVLVFMELGVSLIQAYVFTSLLMLYMSEVGDTH